MNDKIIYISLATLTSVLFIQSIRWSQHRGANVYSYATVNYMTAAIAFYLWAGVSGSPWSMAGALHGAGIGLCYGLTFLLINYCFRHFGVSRTTTVTYMAQAVPILASIVIWHERPSLIVMFGIAGTLIAIPLIVLQPERRTEKFAAVVIAAVALLFFGQGLAFTLMKSFERMHIGQQQLTMLAVLFSVAACTTGSFSVWRRSAIGRREIETGMLTGLLNLVNNFFVMIALSVAAATIVFPTFTASTIALTTLVSMLLWHERYSPRAWLGLAIAVVSVVLINL